MSEEEIKAYNYLKKNYGTKMYARIIIRLIDKQQKEIELLREENFDTVWTKIFEYTCGKGDIEKLMNIIKNQQKEIEELKKDRYLYNSETGEITKIKSNSISKDKIRAKIKEVSNGTFDAKIVLEKLLEE